MQLYASETSSTFISNFHNRIVVSLGFFVGFQIVSAKKKIEEF